MRLGAPIYGPKDAYAYVRAVKEKGYRAAYCPEYIRNAGQEREIEELVCALKEADLVPAEVGTWVNPLNPDPVEAKKAQDYIVDRLKVADQLGARCCVNVIGSASPDIWYGPHPENFSEAFFQKAVKVYREIMDRAEIEKTTMAFEIMPYSFLDCTENYVRFLEAMDRRAVSVHLDFTNLIMAPRALYDQKRIFDEAVERLGSRIASVHLKDLTLDPIPYTTHLKEVQLGTGEIDLGYVLRLLNTLDPDLPVLMEHYDEPAAYDLGAVTLRKIAGEQGIML